MGSRSLSLVRSGLTNNGVNYRLHTAPGNLETKYQRADESWIECLDKSFQHILLCWTLNPITLIGFFLAFPTARPPLYCSNICRYKDNFWTFKQLCEEMRLKNPTFQEVSWGSVWLSWSEVRTSLRPIVWGLQCTWPGRSGLMPVNTDSDQREEPPSWIIRPGHTSQLRGEVVTSDNWW